MNRLQVLLLTLAVLLGSICAVNAQVNPYKYHNPYSNPMFNTPAPTPGMSLQQYYGGRLPTPYIQPYKPQYYKPFHYNPYYYNHSNHMYSPYRNRMHYGINNNGFYFYYNIR